jgi:SAM-dependent methyltransferase
VTLNQDLRRSIKHVIVSLTAPAEIRLAKRRLVSDPSLATAEKSLLRKASMAISHRDGMYKPFAASRYLRVGLSAIRCIDHALGKSSGRSAVHSVLDFPSGNGRVLRFLRARFPDAAITAYEIDREAVDFCRHTFAVDSILSDRDIGNLSLPGQFDLIWCGSLITHVNDRFTTRLLKLFYDHLSPGGSCVFTTHGQYSVECIAQHTRTYELPPRAQRDLITQFNERGYGYADYPGHDGFGISVVSHDRMTALAGSVGRWTETSFWERGWDSHQDVFGFTKPLDV